MAWSDYWTHIKYGVYAAVGLVIAAASVTYLTVTEDEYITTDEYAALLLGTVERSLATATAVSIVTNVSTVTNWAYIADPSGREWTPIGGSSTNFLVQVQTTNVVTNISTNYTCAVSPPAIITTEKVWVGKVCNVVTSGAAIYTNDSPAVLTNGMTNAITSYIPAGAMVTLLNKTSLLIPQYANTNTAPAYDAWTVTGLFAALHIGDGTSVWANTVGSNVMNVWTGYPVCYTSYWPGGVYTNIVSYTSRTPAEVYHVSTNYDGTNYYWATLTNSASAMGVTQWYTYNATDYIYKTNAAELYMVLSKLKSVRKTGVVIREAAATERVGETTSFTNTLAAGQVLVEGAQEGTSNGIAYTGWGYTEDTNTTEEGAIYLHAAISRSWIDDYTGWYDQGIHRLLAAGRTVKLRLDRIPWRGVDGTAFWVCEIAPTERPALAIAGGSLCTTSGVFDTHGMDIPLPGVQTVQVVLAACSDATTNWIASDYLFPITAEFPFIWPPDATGYTVPTCDAISNASSGLQRFLSESKIPVETYGFEITYDWTPEAMRIDYNFLYCTNAP